MKDIIIGTRLNKKVVLMRREGRKIVDTKNITSDFNNVVITMFRGEPKTIINSAGDKYKVTLERQVHAMGSRYGTTYKRNVYGG